MPALTSWFTRNDLVTSDEIMTKYTLFGLVTVTAAITGVAIGLGQWPYALSALGLLAVFLHPVGVVLGLFVFLIPFDSIAILGAEDHGRTLTYFAGAAAATTLVSVGFVSRRLIPPPRSSLWWIGFTLWSVATATWALRPTTSFEFLPTVLALLTLYVASSCFRYTDAELRKVTYLAIAGGCAAAVWTIYLFYQGARWTEVSPVRASLILGSRQTNPNVLAMSLLLPIALAFGYFLSYKRGFAKLAMLLALIVTTLGLLLTMSRGAIVAFIVLLFVYVRRLRVRLRIAMPIAVLAVLLSLMPVGFFTRFQTAAKTGGAGRLDIWTVGLSALKHYGVIGAGLNNFPLAYTNYMGEAPHFKGASRDAHNTFLNIGVESGVIGLFLFVAAIRSSLRVRHQAKPGTSDNLLLAAEAACWSMLAFGMFGTNLWNKAFWFSWTLLAAATQIASASELEANSTHILPIHSDGLSAKSYQGLLADQNEKPTWLGSA